MAQSAALSQPAPATDPDPRVEALLEVVMQLAAGDLAARLAPSEAGDDIDAIILGVNMVAEELQFRQGNLEALVAERTRALGKAMQELERSNAELEQFAYVASHDLQEPLRMVASYVQLLARRYQGRLDADADEFIEYAVDGARRMQVLIGDLLTYARIGSRGGPIGPAPLRAAFERGVANLAATIAEKGATVTAGDLPVVWADAPQLVQVFQNLVGNAIKFGRPGVPVEVRVSAEREDDLWHVRITDNGIGIEQEYAERIFVIFQRLHTREEYAGTGIGLAVCRKIVERNGGTIWMESAVGEGSTFHFTLPAEGAPQ